MRASADVRRLPPTGAALQQQRTHAIAPVTAEAERIPAPPQPGVGHLYVAPPAVPQPPPTAAALRDVRQPLPRAPLSLEALEGLACANNPTIAQAGAHMQAALGMAIQAGLWPNPKMFFSDELLGQSGTAGEFVGGTVQQEIVVAHKQQLSRAKYLARTRVAEWVALEQQFRVLNDVRIHYFRTLGQQQIVAIQRELLKTTEDELLTRREQYNVGQANQADVHRANVALQQQRLHLLMAENRLRASWQSMTALAGVDLLYCPLAGSLEHGSPLISWEDALNRMVNESPQIQAAYAKSEADHMQLQRELVQSVPNITVAGGAGKDYTVTPRQAVGYLKVQMDLPVWNRNEGTVREARSDLARQQAEIRRVELHLRKNLAEVYEEYLTAAQHVHNFQTVILPEARRAYSVQLDSYQQDRIRWSDVLVTQKEYFDLRVQYVEHLVKLREQEVLLVGFLLNDGLKAPPNPVPPGHINVNPQPR